MIAIVRRPVNWPMSIEYCMLALISSQTGVFAPSMLFVAYAISRCFGGHEAVWNPPERSRSFTDVLLVLLSRMVASVMIAPIMGVSSLLRGQSFWKASLPAANLYSNFERCFAADIYCFSLSSDMALPREGRKQCRFISVESGATVDTRPSSYRNRIYLKIFLRTSAEALDCFCRDVV